MFALKKSSSSRQNTERNSHACINNDASNPLISIESRWSEVCSMHRWLAFLAQNIVSLWEVGQVSHHGAYSLNRVEAFREYYQSASILRMLCVCVATTVSPLFVIIGLDAIPLQDPNEGWKANWTLWIRCVLSGFALTYGSVLQFHVTSPAAGLNVKKCLIIALCVAFGYAACMMVLASCWVFPIPFMIIAGVPFWQVLLIISMVITIGKETLISNKEFRFQTKRYINILNTQAPLLLVYPCYSAIFMRLHGANQIAFVFILPVAKFLLKNALSRACTGLDDSIPTIVISVDLFHSIYLSKSLQGSGSVWTTGAVILIDVGQNMMSMWRLHRHVARIHSLCRGEIDQIRSLNIFSIISEACEHSDMLDPDYWHSLQSVGVTSLGNQTHVSSGVTKNNHVAPQANNAEGSKQLVSEKASKKTRNLFGRSSSICPQTPTETKTLLLKRSLELLRRTEFMLLVEYIECAIPLLYAVYLSILYQLPNRKYYAEVEALSESRLRRVVFNVIIYSLLEVASLLYIQWMIQRRFQFSAMRQLAFILEKEFLVVQASFMAWTLIVFQFTVAHFGTDFSFKFSWIQYQ